MKKRTRPTASRVTPIVPSKQHDVTVPQVAAAIIFRKGSESIDNGARGLLEIGQYAFKHSFDGDCEKVGRPLLKQASFRTFADHPDLKISITLPHNAVHLAMQEHPICRGHRSGSGAD